MGAVDHVVEDGRAAAFDWLAEFQGDVFHGVGTDDGGHLHGHRSNVHIVYLYAEIFYRGSDGRWRERMIF